MAWIVRYSKNNFINFWKKESFILRNIPKIVLLVSQYQGQNIPGRLFCIKEYILLAFCTPLLYIFKKKKNNNNAVFGILTFLKRETFDIDKVMLGWVVVELGFLTILLHNELHNSLMLLILVTHCLCGIVWYVWSLCSYKCGHCAFLLCS